MGNDYITVSLPASMIKKIDEVIKNAELGYKSRPEFVKDAVRRRFGELGISFLDGLEELEGDD